MKRAVFLDRDGVINAMVYNADFGLVDSPANLGDFTLLPDVSSAIAAIGRMGLLAVVISNQPGIAKGKFSPSILDAMTGKMLAQIRAGGGNLDGIYYCLHHPQAALTEYRLACDCRKPKPGLLFRAAQELGIDLAQSYMVGDGITDVLAGQAAGVKTIFISSRKPYIYDLLAGQGTWPDYIVSDLSEAARLICQMEAAAPRCHSERA